MLVDENKHISVIKLDIYLLCSVVRLPYEEFLKSFTYPDSKQIFILLS